MSQPKQAVCPACGSKLSKVKGLKNDYQCSKHGVVWKDKSGWHYFEVTEMAKTP